MPTYYTNVLLTKSELVSPRILTLNSSEIKKLDCFVESKSWFESVHKHINDEEMTTGHNSIQIRKWEACSSKFICDITTARRWSCNTCHDKPCYGYYWQSTHYPIPWPSTNHNSWPSCFCSVQAGSMILS